MRKTSSISSIIVLLFLLSLATEQSLMAYADPGSGAMFVQILLAGIIGGLFRIRKVINRFRGPKNGQEFSDPRSDA
jgi:hypothetical protein